MPRTPALLSLLHATVAVAMTAVAAPQHVGALRTAAAAPGHASTSRPNAGGARQATQPCPQCVEMNKPHGPFRIYGNTYFVGTNGLSSILIVSDQGHILIDGDLPESAPQIVTNIVALGFRLMDVKLILNSHDHHDHAGGIAELQRKTGAKVAASRASAKVMGQGHSDPDDPQFGLAPAYPAVRNVQTIKDGETLKVGPNSITAHFTPGHTPGGTTWTWKACEKSRCRLIVYADSLTAVSAEGFLFSNSKTYPNAVEDFHKSFTVLKTLPCDILLTPHPGASDMWPRLDQASRTGSTESWVDPTACQRFAETAETNLNKRLADEVRR